MSPQDKEKVCGAFSNKFGICMKFCAILISTHVPTFNENTATVHALQQTAQLTSANVFAYIILSLMGPAGAQM